MKRMKHYHLMIFKKFRTLKKKFRKKRIRKHVKMPTIDPYKEKVKIQLSIKKIMLKKTKISVLLMT